MNGRAIFPGTGDRAVFALAKRRRKWCHAAREHEAPSQPRHSSPISSRTDFLRLTPVLGRFTRMEIFIFSLLTAASGALFTSIGCRRARIRHRRPGWHLVLLGTVVTVLLTVLCFGQGDLFRPQRWDEYKGGTSGFWRPIIFLSEAAAGVSVLSSLAVILYFRGRFRDVKPVA